MATTIQISEKLQKEFVQRKLFARETYEEVIWDLVEDTQELSEETRKELAQSRAEIRAGKVHSFDQVKEEFGFGGR